MNDIDKTTANMVESLLKEIIDLKNTIKKLEGRVVYLETQSRINYIQDVIR